MLQKFPMYSYIPAADVTRAREFYEGKLGFEPKCETAGGVVYEFANGSACFLYPTPNAGTSRASQAFWQVTNIEGLVAELESRGVTWKGMTCRTWTTTALRPAVAPRPRGSRIARATSWRWSRTPDDVRKAVRVVAGVGVSLSGWRGS